ncbi:MAG: FAD-dependent thymidylate synthase [Microcystis sp. M42BS1]|nr:FAD-dependent thymidylate synthase [Microcystis sp. M42BS1]
MGSDLTVVNAARVSFNKKVETFDPEKDGKLLHYLAKNGHWSPFSHCVLQYHVKAPIFVARQLAKHQVGMSWNEVSRRYVDDPPEFYIPEYRARAEKKKQGSADTIVSEEYDVDVKVSNFLDDARNLYDELIYDYHVAPEIARAFLPLNTYTEWYWTGSLYAFARVCKQRLDEHAQKETREIAQQINDQAQLFFPESWKALMSY